MSSNSATLDISIKDLSGLEKFVGQSNFFQWKYEMERFFDIYGYTEILEGVILCPQLTLSNSKTEEITTWKKKDRMITFVLLRTIDSSIKPIISAYSTGAAQ
jgi:hypothetical protein